MEEGVAVIEYRRFDALEHLADSLHRLVRNHRAVSVVDVPRQILLREERTQGLARLGIETGDVM